MMRKNQVLASGAAALVAAAGLAFSQDTKTLGGLTKLSSPHEAQGASATGGKLKAASDYRVIGYLEKRGRTITIKAGPAGPVYSVQTADGKVLCENLSREQAVTQVPELGNFIRTAIAGDARVKVDASLRMQR